MFRIRRIYDDVLPVNKQAIAEVREIFVEHFAGAPISDIESLGEKLRNPFMQRFRMILYVAENSRGRVSGFAIVLQEPELKFSYLDYLAVAERRLVAVSAQHFTSTFETKSLPRNQRDCFSNAFQTTRAVAMMRTCGDRMQLD